MPDGRPTKTCPDCAETVLAAARKCRFCGYRFEPAAKPPGRPAATGLFALLRRPERTPMSVHDLLDEWGIPYDDDDAEPALFTGTIDAVSGFIAVTRTRFCFVPATRARPAVVREEHLLTELLRVHVRRQRMHRSLFIEWRSGRTVVELDAAHLVALFELLEPCALIRSDRT